MRMTERCGATCIFDISIEGQKKYLCLWFLPNDPVFNPPSPGPSPSTDFLKEYYKKKSDKKSVPSEPILFFVHETVNTGCIAATWNRRISLL